MRKFGVALTIVLVLALLGTSIVLSRSNPSSTNWILNPQDQIILGNVSVRTALNGNIVVIVDQSVTETATLPDGVPDLVFRYAPLERLAEDVQIDLQHVQVVYSARRLLVVSLNGEVLVNLSLDIVRARDRVDTTRQEFEHSKLSTSASIIHVSRGYGLRREIPQRLDDGVIPPINLEVNFIIKTRKNAPSTEDEGAPTCTAGGKGSSSCSIVGCSGTPTGCTTACSSGYACCNCTPSAACSCFDNSGD